MKIKEKQAYANEKIFFKSSQQQLLDNVVKTFVML